MIDNFLDIDFAGAGNRLGHLVVVNEDEVRFVRLKNVGFREKADEAIGFVGHHECLGV